MVYDLIIIGAGASGLFAAANIDNIKSGLILNKSKSPGLKILMSGSGQCNITQGGDIKEFISHYGDNGSKIRKTLYKFSNASIVNYFNNNGISTFQREDGKIFPVSLKSKDILDLLIKKVNENHFLINNQTTVSNLAFHNGIFSVFSESNQVYLSKKVIVATGGASYSETGSDGKFQNVLKNLGINSKPFTPALVPLHVENYSFTELSGISFSSAKVKISNHEFSGGLLLTHTNFSGPAILDISRFAKTGERLEIQYTTRIKYNDFLENLQILIVGNQKQISTVLTDYFNCVGETFGKRFIEKICHDTNINPTEKSSNISIKQIKVLADKFFRDSYVISGNSGFKYAMASAGGIDLDELDLKTFETKKYPGLYVIGEALNIDGDTGGYNLQFAFSSAYICSKNFN